MSDKPFTITAPRARAIAGSAAADIRPAKLGSGASSPAARAEAFADFEAFLVQHALESVLPKDATTVYGKGLAGELWKSMLAEKLAAEIARSGSFGIASIIAASPPGQVAAAPPLGPMAAPASIATPSLAARTDPGWSADVVAENTTRSNTASPEALETGALEP